jgi:hypothetical protein
MRIAAAIELSDEQRQQLEKQARARSVSVRVAQRSKMILLAATGLSDLKIGAGLGREATDRGALAQSVYPNGNGRHRERCAPSWPQATNPN